MANKIFKIYSSSAGSGKTYTLSKTYLSLVIKNPSLYKGILAVTFTNKAAWEMKSRIMEYLYQLSSGIECQILNDLIAETGIEEDKIRENATTALAHVLHNYPMFSVKTIDSFFQSIVQAFTKELGLQGGFEIELDQEKVLDSLVDKVMQDVGSNHNLTKWLIKYSETRVNEGKSWDIKEDIKKLAWEIFNENFKSFEAEIQKNGHIVPELLKALGKIISQFENELKLLGKEALRIVEQHGLQVTDFSYGRTSALGYMEKLATGVISSPGLRVHKAISNPDTLYKKGDINKETILQSFESGLKEILIQVVSLFNQEYPKYTTAIAITRYIYTLGILSDLSLKLHTYREENQALLISDLADFLKKIIHDNHAPFIYEKTGTRYKHFMIDEFQDTSGFQWENFKPLINNSLAEGNINMAVGDVKQSIYRWRGGNWELLLKNINDDIHPENIEKLNLDTNYRSKKMLIRFFNSLFFNAPLIVKSFFENELSPVNNAIHVEMDPEIDKITAAYEDALQLIPLKQLKDKNEGYVNIQFFEDQEDNRWQDQALEAIPGILEKIQDSGCALKDIALLVRNKNDGEKIIQFLMQYKNCDKAKNGYGYDAISSESLYLSAAHSVMVLINALQYLNKQENEIALFNLVFEYQIMVVKNPDFVNPGIITRFKELDYIREHRLLPENFIGEKRRLQALSLYELTETLIRMFNLEQQKGEWPFIQAFLDQILLFVQKERGEIEGFLEWWEKTGIACSIQMPEDIDAAKVLTIHKSKGLQFKAVVLPFCNWDLDHHPQFDNIIWCESHEPPFDMLTHLPVKYTNQLKDTYFSREYFEEKIKTAIDNLNLLYVAETRAQDQLVICGCLPTPKNDGSLPFKTVSDLLFRVFDCSIEPETASDYQFLNLNEYWDPVQHVFEAGSNFKSVIAAVVDDNKTTLSKFISTDWRKRISIKFSAGDYMEGSETREGKIRFGRLVHRVLAKTGTYNDFRKVIKEMYFDGIIDGDEQKLLVDKLEKVFEMEQLREWFSDKYKIKAESPVLQPNGEVLRPDRVMIDGKKAIALDFKSGKSISSDHRQVQEYMLLLQQMGYTMVEGYLLYIDQLEIKKVESL